MTRARPTSPGSLFDSIYERPGHAPPMARRSDPISSHAAADRVERSGKTAWERVALLKAVVEFPGVSSGVLAKVVGMDRHRCMKRLPELRDKYFMAVNQAKKRTPSEEWRWYPTAKGKMLIEKGGRAS